MKILVADDSPTVRNILTSLLKGAGYQVVTAEDGVDAINKVYESAPDLLVLDIFMPKINGYLVCRLLKNDGATRNIPIIILTEAKGRGDRFWSLHTGAECFLTKDFNTPDTILKMINKMLENFDETKRLNPKIVKRGPEQEREILSRIGTLLDKELYKSTLDKMKLEGVVEHLTEGVLVLDENREVTVFNPMMSKMLGIPSDQAFQEGKCCKIFGNSICADGCHFEKFFSAGQDVLDEEVVLKSLGGAAIPSLFSMVLLREKEDRIAGAVCVFKDIRKVKEAEKIKADFMAMVTHELRNPLAIICGTAANVLDGLSGELSQGQKESLETIKRISDHLVMLINDLLDLSKIDADKISLIKEKMDMTALAKRCVEDMKVLAQQKKIKLEYVGSSNTLEIEADAGRIEQVFVNLISNAIKFTPEKGHVVLAIAEQEEMIECSVTDTGMGMPADKISKIFDKYQQIHDKMARKQGGTGLGLAVVKGIVESHGGMIRAESEEGKGSRFIFTLAK